VVSLAPNSFHDVWHDLQSVADALGVAQRGRELVQSLMNRIEGIRRRAQRINDQPTVACIEWIEPLMVAGNWVPELVTIAGGVDCLGQSGKHAPALHWQSLKEANPDYIIAMPCGLGLDRTRHEMRSLLIQAGWKQLIAVRTARVAAADGNQFFNRPGPRLVES